MFVLRPLVVKLHCVHTLWLRDFYQTQLLFWNPSIEKSKLPLYLVDKSQLKRSRKPCTSCLVFRLKVFQLSRSQKRVRRDRALEKRCSPEFTSCNSTSHALYVCVRVCVISISCFLHDDCHFAQTLSWIDAAQRDCVSFCSYKRIKKEGLKLNLETFSQQRTAFVSWLNFSLNSS